MRKPFNTSLLTIVMLMSPDLLLLMDYCLEPFDNNRVVNFSVIGDIGIVGILCIKLVSNGYERPFPSTFIYKYIYNISVKHV
jgi:hypothetical protein